MISTPQSMNNVKLIHSRKKQIQHIIQGWKKILSEQNVIWNCVNTGEKEQMFTFSWFYSYNTTVYSFTK